MLGWVTKEAKDFDSTRASAVDSYRPPAVESGRPPADPRPQNEVQPAVSSSAPAAPPAPPVPSADEGNKLRRRSKWDEAPPDANLPAPAPTGVQPKVLKLESVQIRALIGKGGDTIKAIRNESGADIRIEHVQTDMEGTVTIIGDLDRTEKIIKECLASKGCPMTAPGGVLPKPGMIPPMPNGTGVVYGGEAHAVDSQFDVQIPQELVGMLIGSGGSHLQDVRIKAGNNVFISVLPPAFPMAPQVVRIDGEVLDTRRMAAELIRERIMVLKRSNPMGRIPTMPFRITPPGYLPTGLSPAQALLEGGALIRSLPRPPPPQPQAAVQANQAPPPPPTSQGFKGGFKGPDTGCFTCGGPHMARDCPNGKGGKGGPASMKGLMPLPPPPGPPPSPAGANTGIQPFVSGVPQPMQALSQMPPHPSAAPPGLGEEDWLARAARLAAEKLQDKPPLPRPAMSMQQFPMMQQQQIPQLPNSAPSPTSDLQAAGMEGLAALVAAQNFTQNVM